MYKLPADILRIIYEYDDTYKNIYRDCVYELVFRVNQYKVVKCLDKLNKLYDIEVRKCINNNIRFNSDLYNPVPDRVYYYKRINTIYNVLNILIKNI